MNVSFSIIVPIYNEINSLKFVNKLKENFQTSKIKYILLMMDQKMEV